VKVVDARHFSVAIRVCRGILRLAAFAFGALAVIALPAERLVENRRAGNLAIGHVPNMDPGVLAVFAVFVCFAIVAVLGVIEVTRCWAFERLPLSLFACVVLGAIAAWPVGFGVLYPELDRSYPGVLLVAVVLSVCAFYFCRHLWLAHGGKVGQSSRHET